MEETILDVAIWSGGTLLALFVLIYFLKAFLVIGKPNQVLVFSGRRHTLPNGTDVGFRTVRGGRSIRIPLLERVDAMDMTTMPIRIDIEGAYAKGNIPINVDAVANVKITNDDHKINHAIERFLGRQRQEIREVARETLEGTLRGVLALLTPEEVNHDRQKLANNLKAEVAEDLGKMGLMVDTFKIQHVTDKVEYLGSISRIKIAEVVRDAEIAESNAKRDADQAVAAANMRGKVAMENALALIAEEENDLNRHMSELDAEARTEEEKTAASGLEARARAEQDLQRIRGKLEKLRLQADAVIPAEKDATAKELGAAGDAAIKRETGRAQGEALAALYAAWRAAGERANEIFLIQQIDRILADVAQATESVDVAHVNLIDGGDGRTLARFVGAYPGIVTEILGRIKDTVGVDVAAILANRPADEPQEVK